MLRRRHNNFFQKFTKLFLLFLFNFETIVKKKLTLKLIFFFVNYSLITFLN